MGTPGRIRNHRGQITLKLGKVPEGCVAITNMCELDSFPWYGASLPLGVSSLWGVFSDFKGQVNIRERWLEEGGSGCLDFKSSWTWGHQENLYPDGFSCIIADCVPALDVGHRDFLEDWNQPSQAFRLGVGAGSPTSNGNRGRSPGCFLVHEGGTCDKALLLLQTRLLSWDLC